MFIATNVHLTKEITDGTLDAKLHATITDVQESGNSTLKRKGQKMSKDIIYREDAIKAFVEETNGVNVEKAIKVVDAYLQIRECDEVWDSIRAIRDCLECAKDDIAEVIPSADRPNEVIYGNEHNCIMTIFGECSYAETGCGDCAVVENVRKAVFADRPQEWIPCSEKLPNKERATYLICTEGGYMCSCRWTNDMYGIGSNEWSEWGWHIMDKPQYAKVVAWMPLKSWKGAEDE